MFKILTIILFPNTNYNYPCYLSATQNDVASFSIAFIPSEFYRGLSNDFTALQFVKPSLEKPSLISVCKLGIIIMILFFLTHSVQTVEP